MHLSETSEAKKLRDVAKGEELTLDYALFLDESMEPFACQCGSENCREMVFGVKENAIGVRMPAPPKLIRKERQVVPVPVNRVGPASKDRPGRPNKR